MYFIIQEIKHFIFLLMSRRDCEIFLGEVNERSYQIRRLNKTYYFFKSFKTLKTEQDRYITRQAWYLTLGNVQTGLKPMNPPLHKLTGQNLQNFYWYCDHVYDDEIDTEFRHEVDPKKVPYASSIEPDAILAVKYVPQAFRNLYHYFRNNNGTKIQKQVEICNKLNKMIDPYTGLKSDQTDIVHFAIIFAQYLLLPYM